MPKALGPVAENSARPNPMGNGSQAILKRNQACHQCRRRKLKCDARRPCSTCVRSHAHARSHPQNGITVPLEPDCTFDDVQETVPADTPKTKVERLEIRIKELEAMLKSHNITTEDHFPSSGNSPGSSSGHYTLHGSSTNGTHSSSPEGYDANLIHANWSRDLPNLETTHHLVEMFFTFHPHAGKMFHQATFMSSLTLATSHPKFPIAPVLHAICALASAYTSTTSWIPQTGSGSGYDGFSQSNVFETRSDTFADEQAKLADVLAEELFQLGQDYLSVLRVRLLLGFYYCSQARWVDLYREAGRAVRLSIPLQLNVCPPLQSITRSGRPTSLVPTSKSVVEDETRRNLFWLTYCLERLQGWNNGWAMALDDQDVTQILPLRGDQFINGQILVHPRDRQWAHQQDLLLVHPEEQVDSFILYVKSIMLMSRVKVFNMRFRSRHLIGDEKFVVPFDGKASETVDPRGSIGFVELDQICTTFLSTFPPLMKNPVDNNTVDRHLYSAHLIAHIATIVLHEPHAEVRESGCISALKILTSARAILDMIYAVWSSSYDISLLESFCAVCWFTSGRILVRFLEAANESDHQDTATIFRGEIMFIQSALSKLGHRMPVGVKCANQLNDLLSAVPQRYPPSTGMDAFAQQAFSEVADFVGSGQDPAGHLVGNL